MTGKTIAVLGGGIGGFLAARRLRKELPSRDRVLLIERDREHAFQPSLPFVLSGRRDPAAIERPVAGIAKLGVDVVQADVTAIDISSQTVLAGGEKHDYDYLVIALGAQLDPEAMPGFEESAINVFTPDGAAIARDELRTLKGGRVAVVVSRLPYKCPAAPYEFAFIADALLRKTDARSRTSVDVYTPEPLPMPTTGPAIGHAVASMLAARKIGFHPNTQLQRIDPANRRLKFEDGSDAEYDLILGIPPHRAPDAVSSCDLAGPTGFVPVDKATLETTADGVYAIGDVASIGLADGKFLPKAGVFAHSQADVVASRIADELAGRSPSRVFDGSGSCFLELGNGKAGYAKGNFYGESGPEVRMRREGYHWHIGKVAFEEYWLRFRW
ncbi:MAG: pyridine nucleotide-disulfide oxidoreductase [Acidobacteria bacterium]|nr:MAG: pyridine nucleotide-disulfide oxidoreductase [Acidobacteriota bacterium]